MIDVNPVYVLDACALLRLAQDEPGAEQVEVILADGASHSARVLLIQINLGEVIYRIGKQFGWAIAERKRGEITLLPIEVIAFSDEIFWQAVKLKAQYAMSYADCFAAALALLESGVLFTSDPEFDLLGDAIVRMAV